MSSNIGIFVFEEKGLVFLVFFKFKIGKTQISVLTICKLEKLSITYILTVAVPE